MLLSIQFPFADVRRFLHTPTGCISQPGWPSPVIPQDAKKIPPPFVRGFGAVRKRDGGGLEFWGEDVLCDAGHAIRWQRGDSYPCADGGRHLRFEVAFRRLFFDGTSTGKCELGIATTGRPNFQLGTDDLLGLSRWFLRHAVSVPSFDAAGPGSGRSSGPAREIVPLQEIPLSLNRQVLRATTRTNWLRSKQRPLPDWWMSGGAPMLFLQLKAPEETLADGIPAFRSIELPELGVNISCHTVVTDGISVPLWILWTTAKLDRTRARQLRLCLLRMHAEHESLRIVLDHLSTGRIKVRRDTVPSNLLQHYLEGASHRLFRNQGILEKIYGKENPQDELDIASTAIGVFDRVWPGTIASLEQLLRQIDIRRNIGINLKRYSENQQVQIGALIMKQVNTSGERNIVNVDSTLEDTQQNTGDNAQQTKVPVAPIDQDTMKKEMESLMRQLTEAVAKLPPEHAEDKQAIEEKAAELKAQAEKPQVNKKSLSISAKGMIEAAEGIAGVVPIALRLSGLVASFLAGM